MDTDTNHCTGGCNCEHEGIDPKDCPRMTGNRAIWTYGEQVAAVLEAQYQQRN
jgi:hypothetical protein